MKKILFSAISAFAVVGVALAADSTQFGVLKVPSSAKDTIVAVPWLESGTGNQAVTVSNLVLTAGLQNGDTLKLFENGAYTQGWELKNGAWEPGTVTTGDNVKSQSGNDQTTISRGKAIMLTRPDSGRANCFYLMGKPSDASGEVTLGSPAEKGTTVFTLVAPPSVSATGVNSLTWTGINSRCDALLVQQENGTLATLSWNGTGWQTSDRRTDATIPAGIGAWFTTRDTAAKKVAWGSK